MRAALALPLLDAMVPAFASARQTAPLKATRLSFLAVPNGIIMDRWTPAAIGKGYPITPVLEPLAPFKDRMVVLSGLANNEARKLEFEIAGDHPRLRRLSHGSPPGDIGRGYPLRRLGGPDCGEGARQAHAASILGNRVGDADGGRLRIRL